MFKAILPHSLGVQTNFLLYESEDITFLGAEFQALVRELYLYSILYCYIQGTAGKGQFPETYRKGNHKYVAVIMSRCLWDTRVVERARSHKQQSGNSKTTLFPGQIKTMLCLQYKVLIQKRRRKVFFIYLGVGLDDL